MTRRVNHIPITAGKVLTMAGIDVMLGRNIVIYDCEVKKVPGEDGIGWEDHAKLGISVACSFDYRDGSYRVYLEEDGAGGKPLAALAERLNEADLIVAFNHIQFDNQLLRGCGYELLPDEELFNYDMLVESRVAIAGDKYLKGLKLDDHLKANFGERWMKTANGVEAPRMYQRGEISSLINYCLADVLREKMLFELAWLRGEYQAGTHGLVKVRDPRTKMRGYVCT